MEEHGSDSSDDEAAGTTEGAFDALYVKRLLNLFTEKGIPLSLAEGQLKRNRKPADTKKGYELLLGTSVDNA